ncbi:(d)CMP kinase [Cohnella lubricantis]|uniref:Cytidylate kinase n=1 Tax=Cohnella lubricantis TaxID=2163172 RepID=A0A841T8U9_9BACL|nr:(d)CMP kinase [Cohnella lubricantis]MBB6677724.1 (d)CMP kinase [Cohnella lubricantis]MBP2117686.1 cytidylate kinase [Cohnella lubricantis]
MNPLTSHPINIAIDGPAGAGKSTVARLVASRLHYVYVDTGAMYRAVTAIALERGIPPEDEDAVGRLAQRLRVDLRPGEEGQLVFADGEDVTSKLRTLEVNRSVSLVASYEAVRMKMAEEQRRMARAKGVVMDGRDIGTHVLPDAELKIFLTATPRERALRRFKEMGEQTEITLEQLEQEIVERDRKDSEREIAPLLQAPDARFVDSTGRSIDQIVDEIVEWGRAASRTISAGEK